MGPTTTFPSAVEVGTKGIKDPLLPSWARAEPGAALLPLPSGPAQRRATHRLLTRVRPAARVRLLPAVVLQVPPQPALKSRHRGEVATSQGSPRQRAEPQLHLVQPPAVSRQV